MNIQDILHTVLEYLDNPTDKTKNLLKVEIPCYFEDLKKLNSLDKANQELSAIKFRREHRNSTPEQLLNDYFSQIGGPQILKLISVKQVHVSSVTLSDNTVEDLYERYYCLFYIDKPDIKFYFKEVVAKCEDFYKAPEHFKNEIEPLHYITDYKE